MQVHRQIEIKASADKVWKIVGTDFNNISEWSSSVSESHAASDTSPHGGRVCQIKGGGELVETLRLFDDDQRELAFTLKSKSIPFFVQNLESKWSIEPKGDDESIVHINADIQLMPMFRQLISGRVGKIFMKQADELLGDLQYFVENGKARK